MLCDSLGFGNVCIAWSLGAAVMCFCAIKTGVCRVCMIERFVQAHTLAWPCKASFTLLCDERNAKSDRSFHGSAKSARHPKMMPSVRSRDMKQKHVCTGA